MGAALPRRLIVNADDFGRDPAANEGITEAHDRGILTCASLMVNEPSAAAAVELARRRPNLGVGLHLTLVCGHGALSPEQAPHLVDGRGRLSDNAPKAGMLYFFSRAARAEVEREVTAQVQKFKETGLPLDHVNGHLHLHLHPVVADILLDHAQEWGIDALRWSRDLFWMSWKLGSGPLFYRVLHAVIFNLLCLRVKKRFRKMGIRHTPRVFGLMQTSHVDEAYLLKLLEHLPPGDSEVYSHPSTEAKYQKEFSALTSPKVLRKVEEERIELICYRDL